MVIGLLLLIGLPLNFSNIFLTPLKFKNLQKVFSIIKKCWYLLMALRNTSEKVSILFLMKYTGILLFWKILIALKFLIKKAE